MRSIRTTGSIKHSHRRVDMDQIKGKKQLGMNPSTASHRLVKDLLWKFIVYTGQHYCFCCNKGMSRETFSIEHKIPWLDSKNPKELFFDLGNIAFSHLSCNSAVARRPHKKYETKVERRKADQQAQNKARQLERHLEYGAKG